MSPLFIAGYAPSSFANIVSTHGSLSANDTGYLYFQQDWEKIIIFISNGTTLYLPSGACLMAQVTIPRQKLFLISADYCRSRPGARVVPSLSYDRNSANITDNTGRCLGMDSQYTAFLSWSSCGDFIVIHPYEGL